MTRGLDYVNELANGKQIYKEAKNLLEIYDSEYNCGGFALEFRTGIFRMPTMVSMSQQNWTNVITSIVTTFTRVMASDMQEPVLRAVVLWLILW